MMGGEIEAHSAIGEGSQFSVHVPLKRSTEAVLEKSLRLGDASVRIGICTRLRADALSLQQTLAWYGFSEVSLCDHEDIAAMPASAQVCILVERGHWTSLDPDQQTDLLQKHRVLILESEISLPVEDDRVRAKIAWPWKTSALLLAIHAAQEAGTPETKPADAWQIDSELAHKYPLRILVAEDNPVNQMFAEALLDSLGYRADFVGDGQEAVDAVRRQPYDLVLMDVEMPNLDGIEATRLIRALPDARRHTFVVALTAHVLPEIRAQLQEAGMNAFIAKPIELEQLTGFAYDA
jgi:CheY-like chemotaxis protein